MKQTLFDNMKNYYRQQCENRQEQLHRVVSSSGTLGKSCAGVPARQLESAVYRRSRNSEIRISTFWRTSRNIGFVVRAFSFVTSRPDHVHGLYTGYKSTCNSSSQTSPSATILVGPVR